MRGSAVLLCLFNFIICVNSTKKVIQNDGRREIRLINDALNNNKLSPEVFSAVKRYQCCVDCGENAELMMYGTRAWTFTPQDIYLNFTYPSENAVEINDFFADFVITGFQITVYQSGSGCAGYLDSGGIGERQLKISFVCKSTSSIAYQIWVYGMSDYSFKDTGTFVKFNSKC